MINVSWSVQFPWHKIRQSDLKLIVIPTTQMETINYWNKSRFSIIYVQIGKMQPHYGYIHFDPRLVIAAFLSDKRNYCPWFVNTFLITLWFMIPCNRWCSSSIGLDTVKRTFRWYIITRIETFTYSSTKFSHFGNASSVLGFSAVSKHFRKTDKSIIRQDRL